MSYRVGLIIGSLSSTSINRRLSKAITKLAPPELEFVEIGIGELPLYNSDLDANLPEAVVRLKQSIESSDALLIVTPEYNRSVPGPLKNALDWGSRPWGQNSFTRKPTGIIGASIGKIGTAVAQNSLRPVLAFLDAPQMSAPEAYITFDPEVYGEDGTVHDESSKEFLTQWTSEYAAFVTRVLANAPGHIG
ncbi:MAG TPA: NADPH-dependent FMN reductase [Propionicimonas sp.]|nr:NADPH-dependent FMN reductase [Propionicimonas sp.]